MIADLLKLLTLLEKYPDTLNLEHIKAIRDNNGLLEYFIRLEQGQSHGPKESMPLAVQSLVCSVCKGGMPLYRKDNEWYCLEHISRNITFPIGLHGEDRVKTGRPPEDWMQKSIWLKKGAEK